MIEKYLVEKKKKKRKTKIKTAKLIKTLKNAFTTYHLKTNTS